jgi:hypothetical protein
MSTVAALALTAYLEALSTVPHPNIYELIEKVSSTLHTSGSPLPCPCDVCKHAEYFLRHPSKEKFEMRCPYATNKGHLTRQLESQASRTREFIIVPHSEIKDLSVYYQELNRTNTDHYMPETF